MYVIIKNINENGKYIWQTNGSQADNKRKKVSRHHPRHDINNGTTTKSKTKTNSMKLNQQTLVCGAPKTF